MAFFSMENRPMKKLKLGPPDVYPQDPKQKEDELTPINVKQGFSHTPNLQAEEYGTAKNLNFPVSKVQTFLTSILAKKQEINTLPDTGRKRQIINPKENFHNVTPKSKAFIESWFKDLAGSKPLIVLGKKVPVFNKKEEIFVQLSEYQVPFPRSLWLIKMTSAYFMTVSEAKMKKRQVPDSSQEWTVTLTRFLKEQLSKLQEFYNKHSNSVNTLISGACNGTAYHNGNPMMSDEQKLALRQFNYCKQLSKIMMEEGLIESHDFLIWILDILDRCKTSDDGLLKLVLPVALQFIDEFTQCEMLSRKLAVQIAKKLSPLLMSDQPSERSALSSVSCQHHRGLVVQLSAIMQALVLHCPTALVWSHPGEGKVSSHLIGSPLDHLAIAPSALPMAPRFSNDHLRELLRESEASIRRRSKAAEARWSLDQICIHSQTSPNQNIHFTGTNRILQALDSLDRHCFDRVDQFNNIDHLYAKIFPSLALNKTSVDAKNTELAATFAKQDEPLVLLLSNWAVSDHRYGEHRALATALLLEKRQLDIHSLFEAASGTDETIADEISQVSLCNPIYQGLLMKFLDSEAPTSSDPNTTLSGNRASFASLVHLFYELIKHDVFSHDTYMRTLISRGDLQTMSNGFASSPISSSSSQPSLTTPGAGVASFQCLNDLRSEVDDSKIDDDLGKLLQHIKEDQQIVTDNPDSPKDDSTVQLEVNRTDKDSKRQSRHLAYTTHFPLPQDDHLVHDCNQRHILLYGVGKAREEARHVVKRVSKEICRLFHKKLAIDVLAEGTGLAVSCLGSTFFNSAKSRKHSSRLEYNFEQSMQRFLALSYFDRHTVASQAAAVCVEMINTFATGGSMYLPILEHVSFLFDLFEVSLCLSGLIELCLQILRDLPEVEVVLSQKSTQFTHGYTTSMGLYIVGVFRRFHSCLLLSAENTSTAFETLCKLVKHVTNPADCSSAERCILAYLYDLYSCCSFLKNRGNLEPLPSSSNSRDAGSNRGSSVTGSSETFAFSNAYPKIKQTIIAPVQPSSTTHPQNREFLQDYIANPRRKLESQVLRQLCESPQSRYAFVYNVVIAVGNEVDNDRVNDLALLCAELTASCSSLSSEWLGVLSTLCCAGRTYIDVLTLVDVQDIRIHRNLAIFFSILLARHCFGLHDFLLYVGLPALVTIWNEGVHSDTDSKIEAGARLTCHLVLRLFRTFDSPNPTLYGTFHSVAASPHSSLQPMQSSQVGVKLACDRHLLASLHNYIAVGPVLAVLKAILVLADRIPSDVRGSGPKTGGNSNGNNKISGTNLAANELSMSHILGTSWGGDIDIDTASSFSVSRSFGVVENVSLSSYARYVLKKICSQAWVHHRCLQNPDELLKADVLLDSCLSFRQAQRLLEMISRPDSKAAVEENDSSPLDYRQVVNRVLTNLDQWRLRVAWLDLQLLSQQLIAPNNNVASNPTEINLFLDAVARAVIDVFDFMPSSIREDMDQSASVMNKKRMETPTTGLAPLEGASGCSFKNSSISLIGPLVSKLPSAVQARVIRTACQVLETCNWTPPPKVKEKDRSTGGSIATNRLRSLLSYEPFLSLIMTCLRSQEDQRESFLTSLHQQLSQFVFLPKEDRLYQTDECKNWLSMSEALQLRISLLGGLFDAILRNPSATIDWAVLLTQLVTSGTIDQSNNSELFTTVQDMLATLLHSLVVADSQSDRSEDSRKYYPTLIKKLKKELAERKNSSSTQHIKQLLPLPKTANEYVICESYGTQTDNKGNKISGFDSSDKKQGHRLHEKQRVSPWEVLEGHKTAAPLSWAWFGAVRVERKPLRHQEVQRLLRHHTHSLHKPSSYFLEHPSFPPEEIETPVEKVVMKEETNFKMDTPASDQSPRGASKRGQKTNQRRPRARRGAAANVPAPTQVSIGYQNSNTGIYVPNQPTSQWVGYNPPPSVTAQPAVASGPAAPFFQQQTGQGSKFPSERPGTTRQALSNMLRQRQPSAQFVSGSVNPTSMAGMPSNSSQSGVMPGPRPNLSSTMPGQPQFPAMHLTDKQRQQQFMRQQVRSQQPNNTMFGQGNPPQQQIQGPSASQSSQQIPINQGNYSNMQGSVNSNFGMFPNGAQSNMQLVNSQQVQNQPSQQGLPGVQPFSQGNNFSMPQPQSGVNVMPIGSQVQGRGLGNAVQRPPFIQNNMSMNSGQGGQFARGSGPSPSQQPGVRSQQQMPPMQQQQQHMQHMNHSLGQHYHQPY